MYKVIDNLAPLSLQNEIQEIIMSREIGWNYNETTLGKECEHPSIGTETPQFVNSFTYDDGAPISNLYYHIVPLLYFLEYNSEIRIKKILRFKSNLLLKQGVESLTHPPHVDSNLSNHLTFIYYPHDCDGDTVLYDSFYNNIEEKFEPEKQFNYSCKVVDKITPKKGRGLMFKSNQFHSSSTPLNYSRRVVISAVLEI